METHRYLNAGEKIQAEDEYNNGSVWHTVPKFLIGDTVPANSGERWRRINRVVIKPPEKKWFSFLFGK